MSNGVPSPSSADDESVDIRLSIESLIRSGMPRCMTACEEGGGIGEDSVEDGEYVCSEGVRMVGVTVESEFRDEEDEEQRWMIVADLRCRKDGWRG